MVDLVEKNDIERLDRLFLKWAEDLISGKISTPDGQPATVILNLPQRWVQVMKQGNQNVIYPSLIVKRKFDIRPSTDRFAYKSFLNAKELYRKINKERSEKTGQVVYDIASVKTPTFIDVPYEIILLSAIPEDSNMFHTLLFGDLQRNLGYIYETKTINEVEFVSMGFDIILQDSLDASNAENFLKEQKKFFVGASFTLKGWFLKDSDIKITQNSPRTKIEFIEYSDPNYVFD